MRLREHFGIFCATFLVLATWFSPPVSAQDNKRPDLVLKGDAACTRCHNEGSEFPVLAIGKTPHGTGADARTPTCTSCHGVSETHVRKPRDAIERPRPDILFGRGSPTASHSQDAACLSCHEGGKRMHWSLSMHAGRDTTCTSCHQVHAQHDPVRDKTTQAAVCLNCHKEQRAQISRPHRHPILEGKVACSDCHNPHGSAGPKNMVRDSVNDTCYQCHMEKRGPFVRSHQPVQEDCSICHNPHGTTLPSLLKIRSPFLCQSCHEPTGHRARLAQLGIGSTGANFEARGCMNCHTQIHGSNNPQDLSNTRGLRR